MNSSTHLDDLGQKLLELLVQQLANAVPGKPETFITYKQVHERLGLQLMGQTYGDSLLNQGLNSVAKWSATTSKPGITGLIIDGASMMPGRGYFDLYRKKDDDFAWWKSEIRSSKQFDWTPYLGGPGKLNLDAPPEDHAHANELAWSDDELNAAVVAYLDMQSRIASGNTVVKKHYYTELAHQFDRTVKSFEFRMQNISYVLALKGREWIRGLPPARNVGSNVANKIEELLGLHESTLAGQLATFEVRVAEAARKLKNEPRGCLSPHAVQALSLQFVRDPEVKAWVLKLANGVCECCGRPAPFNSVNGPFLEVHHVQRLADKGADTVENAIAVCPNCHRQLHYAVDAAEVIAALYKKVSRLHKLPR